MKRELIKDMGDTVICDICDEDYTDSDLSGGFIFGSYAYCPKCAADRLPKIKEYGEEWNIKARCPEVMSFKDFVVAYRGKDNKVEMITPDEGEDFSDMLKKMRGEK